MNPPKMLPVIFTFRVQRWFSYKTLEKVDLLTYSLAFGIADVLALNAVSCESRARDPVEGGELGDWARGDDEECPLAHRRYCRRGESKQPYAYKALM